jgi:hypothetical protein
MPVLTSGRDEFPRSPFPCAKFPFEISFIRKSEVAEKIQIGIGDGCDYRYDAGSSVFGGANS